MSKRSLFWGQASGKLGEAVFYRAGGEQRTRAWLPTIKNPRTRLQAVNRASMANLTNFYRSMKSVLSLSFTNRKQNQSGFNAFVHYSKNSETGVIGELARQKGLSFPLDFRVSDGVAAFSPYAQVAYASENDVVQVAGLSLFSFKDSENTDPGGAGIANAQGLASALAKYLADKRGWFDGLPRRFTLYAVFATRVAEAYRPVFQKFEIDGSEIATFLNVQDIEQGLSVIGQMTPVYGLDYSWGTVVDNDGTSHIVLAYAGDSSAVQSMQCFAGAFVAFKDENGSLVTSPSTLAFSYYGDANGEDGISPYVEGGVYYEEMVQALTGSSNTLV